MYEILISIFISFFISFVTIPVIINIASIKKLYDIPDSRKIHTKTISSLGGVGIFAGFILACLITISFKYNSEIQYFIAAAFVIFFVGLKDDILIISPQKKFIGQILAVLLITAEGGVRIESMHGFIGFNQLPVSIGYILGFLIILAVINAFNLIDGIDGLAASLGIMSCLILGGYFSIIGSVPYSVLSFSLMGSLVGFLFFNRSPAKIFMGDTGSLLIGLIVSILVIHFINIAPGNSIFPVDASPAIGLSIIMIPLLDTCRVFGIRILNGRSPFSADKNHIHHIFLRYGLGHNQITVLLVLINIVLVLLVFLSKSTGSTVLIFFQTMLFFSATTFFNDNFRHRFRLVLRKGIVLKINQPDRKIEHSEKVNNPMLVEEV